MSTFISPLWSLDAVFLTIIFSLYVFLIRAQVQLKSKIHEYWIDFTWRAQLYGSGVGAITVNRTSPSIDLGPIKRIRDLFFFLFRHHFYNLSSHDFSNSYKYIWSSFHSPLSGHVHAFVETPHWLLWGSEWSMSCSHMFPHLLPFMSWLSHLLPLAVLKKSLFWSAALICCSGIWVWASQLFEVWTE